MLQGLEESAGSWKDEDHPALRELGDVRSLRKDLWARDQDALEPRS